RHHRGRGRARDPRSRSPRPCTCPTPPTSPCLVPARTPVWPRARTPITDAKERDVARISADEVERLNTEVSLERLAQAKGVKLERRADEVVGLCPFCASETTTLRITPKTNRWRCDGACKK